MITSLTIFKLRIEIPLHDDPPAFLIEHKKFLKVVDAKKVFHFFHKGKQDKRISMTSCVLKCSNCWKLQNLVENVLLAKVRPLRPIQNYKNSFPCKYDLKNYCQSFCFPMM